MSSTTTTRTPYADSAAEYLDKGWAPLPVPFGEKWPPPPGFTGASAPDPTLEQVTAWTEARGSHNVAVRMPANVIGIDVDAYAGKRGAATIAELEARLGALPPTFVLTSRDDGASGVRLYRYAGPRREWPGQLGTKDDGVDILTHEYRYAVASPSLHPEGRDYRFLNPDGRQSSIPRMEDLAELPAAHVEDLALGPLSARTKATDADVDAFLAGLDDGEPSSAVSAILRDFETTPDGPNPRRKMLGVVDALAVAGAGGAYGVPAALARARAAYLVVRPGDGDEYDRALKGSVDGLRSGRLIAYDHPDRLAFHYEGEADSVDVEEAFWSSRPELETIRTFARARIVSPWATLGGVLADVVSTVPPTVRLPPTVGGEGSLNLIVGMVGPSGSGKGAALEVAAEVLGHTPTAPELHVGSGEGLVHAYVATEKVKDEDSSSRVVSVQHAESVRFRVHEIDTLLSLASRSGATILPMLRSAFSGESLGFQNADAAKRGIVPSKGYRFTLTAGIQPGRSGGLLEDSDGGTPQRFLWLPSVDPTAPDTTPEPPAPLAWQPLTYGSVVRHLKIPQTARKTIIAAQKARNRGTGEALDGHSLYTRLKVAAALATLARRFEVTDEDWHLAGNVMAVSDRTRAACETEIRKAQAEQGKKAAQARGIGDVIAAEVRDKAMEKKAAANVRSRLEKADDWTGRKVLRGALRSDQRGYLDAALDSLLVAGDIEERPGAQGSRDFRLTRR